MAVILDGKKLSHSLALALAREISAARREKTARTGRGVARTPFATPKLVIFQVGDRAESNTYIKSKKIFGEKIGAVVEHIKYGEKISQKKLVAEIGRQNADRSVHGIIVQLPIPAHLDPTVVVEAIDSKKDVDGLTSRSVKGLFQNKAGLMPATTKGILTLLDKYRVGLAGKKAVVVGRSVLVGKPTALALLNRGATVTICHRRTRNLAAETRRADILVVAAGHPKLITKNHVRPGQVVIDVGINFVGQSARKTKDSPVPRLAAPLLTKQKLVGDVDFAAVQKVVRAISPVPGGVGPMTIVSLFDNLLAAWGELDLGAGRFRS